MIKHILNPNTTIDEILYLDDPTTNSNCTNDTSIPKKKIAATKYFLVGGMAIACVITAPFSANPSSHRTFKYQPISQETVPDTIKNVESDFLKIEEDVNLINKSNLLDIDSMIDGDEIKEEMEIISDYMENAKDIYAYCNQEFTI